MNKPLIHQTMKKFSSICLIALFLMGTVVKAQNTVIGKTGPFEITNIDDKSVTFNVVSKTSIYNVAFVSGNQTIDATFISNIVGDLVFSNGATAREGSQLMMPRVSTLQSGEIALSAGMVITCTFNQIPAGFSPQRVMFQTGKTANPMYFDVPSGTVPTNTVTYENKTYTVSLGTVASDGRGTVAVEILTEEKIEIPMKNGALVAPIMMKIEAGGRTLLASNNVSILDNSMTFDFGEMPDKVIVFGNDGNPNTPTVTFTITKDKVKTVVKSAPATPTVPQTQPQPGSVAQKTATQQTPSPTQQTEPATQKTQPEVPFVQQSKPLTSGEKWQRWYAEIGISVGVLAPDDAYNMDSMTPVGAAINFGVYLKPKHRLSLDIAFGSHDRGEIGTFTYTKKYSNGTVETFTDGVISREYYSTTVLLSYHYIFTPWEKCHIRLGPSVGGHFLSGSDKYKPVVDDTPDPDKDSDVRAVIGIGTGFIWKVGKRCLIDCGYRLLAGGELDVDDFYVTSPAHQFSLTFGFRF